MTEGLLSQSGFLSRRIDINCWRDGNDYTRVVLHCISKGKARCVSQRVCERKPKGTIAYMLFAAALATGSASFEWDVLHDDWSSGMGWLTAMCLDVEGPPIRQHLIWARQSDGMVCQLSQVSIAQGRRPDRIVWTPRPPSHLRTFRIG